MATPMRPTQSLRPADVTRRWYVADVRGQILGRVASQLAHVLRGKHKPTFSPHVDGGDFVIVINAGQVKLTGRKLQNKLYYRHSGYPGGLRAISAGRLLEKHPERVIEHAVRGMLPKGPLGRRMLSKLKVYAADQHPHAAQQPVPLVVAR